MSMMASFHVPLLFVLLSHQSMGGIAVWQGRQSWGKVSAWPKHYPAQVVSAARTASICASPACIGAKDVSLLQTNRNLKNTRFLTNSWKNDGARRMIEHKGSKKVTIPWETNASHTAAVSDPNWETIEVPMPWETGHKPLVRCPAPKQQAPAGTLDEAETQLQLATSIMCDAGLGAFVEYYVDPRFAANYERIKGKDGWIEKAFVTYMKLNHEHSARAASEDLLVQSVHHFSKYPVVLTNYGILVPSHLTPERFPHLVLVHARKSASEIEKDFNFNKLNTMMFTKVRTGMVLDADQWVNRGVDSMFERVSEETTKAYPYPVLPVHFMTREEATGAYVEYGWHFKGNSQGIPNRTMSWGHAHPTWTYYALPWLAKWTSYVMAPDATGSPGWLKEQGFLADEDLLNIASWADGLTKQWCKFDVEGAGMFEAYLTQPPVSHSAATTFHATPTLEPPENKYYPFGIPRSYITCHDAKDPAQSLEWLSKLWHGSTEQRLQINYDGKWFADGKALKEYDPTLKCII